MRARDAVLALAGLPVVLALGGCPYVSAVEHGERVDPDADGSPVGVDCDDVDPTVFPGAVEVWYDGKDQDCDGNDDDQDGDGVSVATDCDDMRDDVNPAATEVCGDGVDQDCLPDPTACRTVLGVDDATVVDAGDEGDLLGVALVSGDLDSDGRGDLVVAAGRGLGCGADGFVRVRLGDAAIGPSGRVIQHAIAGGYYVRPPVAARNGELMIGSPCSVPGVAHALRVTGSDALETVATLATTDNVGRAVAYLPDVDGDQLAERATVNVGDGQSATGNRLAVFLTTGEVTGLRDASLFATANSGWGLAIASGDVDDDDDVDLVTSAPRESDDVTAVFEADVPRDDTPHFVRALARGTDNAEYGASLAACDLDGDGDDDLVAGSPLADSPTSEAGAVYIYAAPVQAIATQASITIGGTVVNGKFGIAVACDGDFDGDGRIDLAVGAPGQAGDAGVAYVFLGGPDRVETYTQDDDAIFTATGAPGSHAGVALAFVHDPYGDGRDALAVGAPTASGTRGAVGIIPGRTAE